MDLLPLANGSCWLCGAYCLFTYSYNIRFFSYGFGARCMFVIFDKRTVLTLHCMLDFFYIIQIFL
jgi:hypothetical protein